MSWSFVRNMFEHCKQQSMVISSLTIRANFMEDLNRIQVLHIGVDQEKEIRSRHICDRTTSVRQLPWDHGEEHDSNVSTQQPEVAGQTTCKASATHTRASCKWLSWIPCKMLAFGGWENYFIHCEPHKLSYF
jgi:hypothetical protein